ncbi:hypothetical protein Vretimale_7684 [Volvox reticuliferus]|uniref:PX domain-containing protein n=1 Tax=Volvox reticuliferus TaxID=1737510 RepID=A0A8J4G9Y1_9CHLO|nr:hypothetical protein Vretimale_7684 [Volvox reticuliferus]
MSRPFQLAAMGCVQGPSAYPSPFFSPSHPPISRHSSGGGYGVSKIHLGAHRQRLSGDTSAAAAHTASVSHVPASFSCGIRRNTTATTTSTATAAATPATLLSEQHLTHHRGHSHCMESQANSTHTQPHAGSSVATATTASATSNVRKSASNIELGSCTSGAVGTSGGDGGCGSRRRSGGNTSSGGGAATLNGMFAAADGATAAAKCEGGGGNGGSYLSQPDAADSPTQPRGLSSSYHAGMDRPQPPSHSRHPSGGHPTSTSYFGGQMPLDHRGGSIGADGGKTAVGKHRRSCSYDVVSARTGDVNGSGDTGAAANTAVGAGGAGAGGGPSSSSRAPWFDFDFGGGLIMPWQKAGTEPPPAQQQQYNHREQHVPQERTQSPQRIHDSGTSREQQNHHHRHHHQRVHHQHENIGHKHHHNRHHQEQRPVHHAGRGHNGSSSGGAGSGGSGSWCRANVAAFEMVSEPLTFGLTAEYVVYKIRVADVVSGREWTVARRFRSFESMAAKLAATQPRYASLARALPPKRLFVHSADVTFVNSRRADLDTYLQQLLDVRELAECGVLREFLLPDQAAPAPAKRSGGGAAATAPDGNSSASPLLTGSIAALELPAAVWPAAAARNLLERVAVDLRGLRRRAVSRRSSVDLRPPAQTQQPSAPGVGSSAGVGGNGGGAGRSFAWLTRRGDNAAAVAMAAPPAPLPGKADCGASAAAAAEASMEGSPPQMVSGPEEEEEDLFDDLLDEEDLLISEEQEPLLTPSDAAAATGPTPSAAAAPSSSQATGGGGFRFGLPAWASGAGESGSGGFFAFPSVQARLRQYKEGAAAAAPEGCRSTTSFASMAAALSSSRGASPERMGSSWSRGGPISGSQSAQEVGVTKRLMAALRGAATAAAAAAPADAYLDAQPLPLTPAASESPTRVRATAAEVVAGGSGAGPPAATAAAAGGVGSLSSHSFPLPAAGAAGSATVRLPVPAAPAMPPPPLPMRPSIEAPVGSGIHGVNVTSVRMTAAAAATPGEGRTQAESVARGSGAVTGTIGGAATTSSSTLMGLSLERPAQRVQSVATAVPTGTVRVFSVPNSPIAAHTVATGAPAPPPRLPSPPLNSNAGGHDNTTANGAGGGSGSGATATAAVGISAPLYELVDVLFGLQGQGFFRRQVWR